MTMTITGPYAEASAQWIAAGWAPIPLPPEQKGPPPPGYTGWAGLEPSSADVYAWADGPEGRGNIALRLPRGVYGLDVDAYGDKSGAQALTELVARCGPLPHTWAVTSREDGSGIRLFRAVLPAGRRWLNEPGGHGRGIESIHFGHRYAVTWPSVHPATRNTYVLRWTGDGRVLEAAVPIADLPELPAAWIEALSEAGEIAVGAAADRGATQAAVQGFRTGDPCPPVARCLTRGLEHVREAGNGAALHPVGLESVHELVRLGHEGHAGVMAALVAHFHAFVEVRSGRDGGDHHAAEGEWWRLVAGAVGKLPGAQRAECDCRLLAGDGLLFEPAVPSMLPADIEAEDIGVTFTAEDEAVQRGIEALMRGGVPGDDGHPFDTAVALEADKLRVRNAARELVDAERWSSAWKAPATYGTLRDELALPDPGEQWRIKGLLGEGHNAILVASRKAGKTTMVNSLVRSVVDGGLFLDQFQVIPDGRDVAIFNYEVGEHQYRRWLRECGIENADRVHVLHLRGTSLPLRHDRVRAWVTEWLAERDIGLWVLDPYSRAYIGSVVNPNDEGEVGMFTDTLDVIKSDAGVGELVMPVHTPKAQVDSGEETAIGSQRLEAWADAMWFLTKDLLTKTRFLRAEGRDVDVDERALAFDIGTRRLSMSFAAQSRAQVRLNAAVTKVVAYVTANPGSTGNQIEGALSLGASTRKAAVEAACAEGRIYVEDGPNRSKLHYVQAAAGDPATGSP